MRIAILAVLLMSLSQVAAAQSGQPPPPPAGYSPPPAGYPPPPAGYPPPPPQYVGVRATDGYAVESGERLIVLLNLNVGWSF